MRPKPVAMMAASSSAGRSGVVDRRRISSASVPAIAG
jgi:hypothetical protein